MKCTHEREAKDLVDIWVCCLQWNGHIVWHVHNIVEERLIVQWQKGRRYVEFETNFKCIINPRTIVYIIFFECDYLHLNKTLYIPQLFCLLEN